ncbi:MAG: hypothetical protein Q4B01_05715 [Eubacteriales bacterium]|nr:hypothetical protein [Eubacteriales bacterium]
MRKTVSILIAVSLAIYGLQLLIFHDPKTTSFYILQDLAFMPFTIAIATLVVGEVMDSREKKERKQKTQMLTSTFFTELGAPLMLQLKEMSEVDSEIVETIAGISIEDEASVRKVQEELRRAAFRVSLNEESYTAVRDLILEKQTMLLVIASNPLLIEHEEFTDMLWNVFHLIDEFRLRGAYAQMSQADRAHLENDLAGVLKLILISWSENILYIKENYPNFYNTSLSKLGLKKIRE